MRFFACIALTTAAIAVAPAAAQKYRQEIHHDCLVKYEVHEDLGPIPLRLGSEDIHLRAKFEPVGEANYIHGGPNGPYNWYIKLLEFRKDGDGKPVAPITGPGGKELELPKEVQEFINKNKPAGTWEEHIRANQESFEVEGKSRRGKSKSQPDYTWWEFKEESGYRFQVGELHWYTVAACYQVDENRQVVLAVTLPAWKKGQPQKKHYQWAQRMVTSLRVMSEDEAVEMGINANQDRYADTPFKLEALTAAKKNIESLSNWSHFTTPNYIVLFSWDYDDAVEDAGRSLKFARRMAKLIEDCREHYQEVLPPHDNMMQLYSVLRICYTRVDFEKYGGTSLGVVGWFNPGSKELVIFDDREGVYGNGEEQTISTLFHEGWHQYGHTYFGEDVELHRWFGEGMGDYFGAHRKAGRGWKHEFDKGRITMLKQMVPRDKYVPLEEIVTWNKDKFYGPDAVKHYSQGYSMVEFLKKGRKVLGGRFEKQWDDIIPLYIQTMLKEKDQAKAVETAFAGVDWVALDAAWKDFVKKAMF